MTPYRKRLHKWVALAAAGWAFVFAVFHVVWAAGWYVGLNAREAAVAFAEPTMLAYDLIVVGMCLVAVPVSLALPTPASERPVRPLVLTLARVGTTLLVLRAVASIAQVTYELFAGRFSAKLIGIWEPWFYIGAALFSTNLWLHARHRAHRNIHPAPGAV